MMKSLDWKSYPYPIVKHEEARAKALNAFKKFKFKHFRGNV